MDTRPEAREMTPSVPSGSSSSPLAAAEGSSHDEPANSDRREFGPVPANDGEREQAPNLRARADSNAPTLSDAAAATPRAHADSPLAARLARAGSSASRPGAAFSEAKDRSLRGRGYDPTTRRNLITGAAADGDLERLQALVSPPPDSLNPEDDASGEAIEGSGPSASTFALANESSPHTGVAPVHVAALNGHEDLVKWLVEEAGALPDFEDAQGETPLHKAALRGHLDVCRFLLSRQVNVNAADNDGWTPLHNAASRGWLDVARLLLTFGAAPDASSRHGYTPLMNAASKGHLPLVHFLLRNGHTPTSPASTPSIFRADPLSRNVFGETAYDLAAGVFEFEVCRVLQRAEVASLRQTRQDARYNPLQLHTTVPVMLFEHQRLVTPTLRRPATLVPGQGDHLVWSSKALSRNDRRAAFSFPTLYEREEEDGGRSAEELPCFRFEVGLPVVGNENELRLPPARPIRSGGRIQVEDPDRRPTPRRRELSQSERQEPADPGPASTSARAEPAWMWVSDWTLDLSSPTCSPMDGWSYAPSFDAPAGAWTATPPSSGSATGEAGSTRGFGQKWVRRRAWARVMRRRVDLPDWGFEEEPARAQADASEASAAHGSVADEGPGMELARMDYRARARFLAGEAASMLPQVEGDTGDLDGAEVRQAVAQLSQAIEALRQGLADDADERRRRDAEEELEGYLRTLAVLRVRQGQDTGATPADEDEGEFLYTGVDADEEDDNRSVWTAMRPPSFASSSVGGARLLGSRSASFQSTSSRPVLTPQIAPEFRVPTNETAIPPSQFLSSSLRPQSLRPRWEPDDATNSCRRCDKHFSLLNRRHHCRKCGLVVCAACSSHSDVLDPRQVAIEPGSVADDSPWLLDSPFGYRYRTCSECHAALALNPADPVGPASLLSPQAFFPTSFPTSPSLPGSAAASEAAASDVSELVECPVCGEALAGLGGKDQQEVHIRDCLEAGRGTIASGRYLLFRLPPGPLVGEDCNICWTEFEVGDRMARLVCLCTFHESCLSGWLARGNSCPVHALRE